jgi:lysostaphin
MFLATLIGALGLVIFPINTVLANSAEQTCPEAVQARIIRHKVANGETLASIAARYNLLPESIIAMNSGLGNGNLPVGREIFIPPFNGFRVQVAPGKTWRQVAATYKVRADVLFELNGCQKSPRVVFVPTGIRQINPPSVVSPAADTPETTDTPSDTTSTPNQDVQLAGYPLPEQASIALAYGWQKNPETGKVFFHGGVDLLAPVGTQVQSIGDGTVAFAGEQGSYGNLVVINHTGGMQTRYAHLQTIDVKVGDTIQKGDVVGIVGMTGKPSTVEPHLHFEVRSSSNLGWVAQDPNRYLQSR